MALGGHTGAVDQSQLYAIYDRDPAPIVNFFDYLRSLYGLPRPGAALDMGCGPGRLLAPMDAAGWVVTGFEPDPDYAAQAELRVRELGRGSVRRAGFLDLNDRGAFDLIAAVNGPYCYLLDPTSRRDALVRCARALRPGGVLFLEFSNFDWILQNYREPPSLSVQVGTTTVTRTARHEIDRQRGSFKHHDRFTWIDQGGTPHEATKTHHMAMVTFAELTSFLEEAGFEKPSTFNGYEDLHPGNLTGPKILVAALIALRGAS
jgi:SAM-dependent methyltransferase